jgi:hypothetical protein
VNVLSETKDKLQGNLRDTAFRHWRNFDALFKIKDLIRQTVNSTVKECETVLPDRIGNLCDCIASFSESTQMITSRWKTTSFMLSRHQQVLEWLELPALMEYAVNMGSYEEALKMFAHVVKVHSKNPRVPLIEKVYEDTVLIRDSLMLTLLNELKKPCQLPTCMKLISFIKKLEVFDEVQVRIMFLSCRDSYLDALFKSLPTSPPLMHLSQFLEVSKVNIFDIATQYKAIFPPTLAGENTSGVVSEEKILSSWLMHRVDFVVSVIQDDLVSCIESDPFYPIDDMIDPCLYLGLSLSRVGCDIRLRIFKIFNTTFLRRLTRVLGRASNAFDKELNLLQWKKLVNNIMIHEEKNNESSQSTAPTVLIQIIPLARLLNSILSALNEIHINSASLIMNGCRVRDIIQECLVRSTECILSFCRKIQTEARVESDVKSSRDFCEKLCTLYVQYLVPHVNEVLSIVFPSSSLAKLLGVSTIDFIRLTKSLREKEGVMVSEEDNGSSISSCGINFLMQVNAKSYLLDNYLPLLDLLKDEDEVGLVDKSKAYSFRSKETGRQTSLEEELLFSLKSKDLPDSSSAIVTGSEVKKEASNISRTHSSSQVIDQTIIETLDHPNQEILIAETELVSNTMVEVEASTLLEPKKEGCSDLIEIVIADNEMENDNQEKHGLIDFTDEENTTALESTEEDNPEREVLIPQNQQENQDKDNEKACLERQQTPDETPAIRAALDVVPDAIFRQESNEEESLGWDDWGDEEDNFTDDMQEQASHSKSDTVRSKDGKFLKKKDTKAD